MKKQFKAIVSVVAFLAASAAFAQTGNSLHVKIPFDFAVSGQKMPAGDYLIEETSPSGAILIRCLDTRQSAIVIGEPGTASGAQSPGLTFERRNGEVHLVRIVENSGPARILPVRE